MLLAEQWRLLKNPNWRFFFRLLAAHVSLGAVLVPLNALLYRDDLPWSAYLVFGVVWWLFVLLVAARLVYQVAWAARAATRWGMVVGGACGLAGGGFFSLAETGFVAGFPPIVLFFTPFLVFGATFVGGACGWLAGLGANALAGRLVR